MNESRLIDLETKFSHQEFIIEELQTALFEQHKTISSLEKSLKLLKDRVDAISPSKTEATPVDEKPPHY